MQVRGSRCAAEGAVVWLGAGGGTQALASRCAAEGVVVWIGAGAGTQAIGLGTGWSE